MIIESENIIMSEWAINGFSNRSDFSLENVDDFIAERHTDCREKVLIVPDPGNNQTEDENMHNTRNRFRQTRLLTVNIYTVLDAHKLCSSTENSKHEAKLSASLRL